MQAKRLNPTWKTRRELFLLSMNECAFPKCDQIMIDQSGHFIGEICHIEAAKEDGQRFNPNKTDEDRRNIQNLVLMCPTHHKLTDNVEVYDVDTMRKIKADHESKSFINETIDTASTTFADRSIEELTLLPKNLEELELTDFERDSPSFFKNALELFQRFANIPRLTRSFYAHGLLNSSKVDLSLYFDPRELETRLSIDHTTIFHHAAILQRNGLLSELDNEEHQIRIAYWFTTFDFEDNQILLLQLIYKRFSDTPLLLLDIFENLNFNRLEKL